MHLDSDKDANTLRQHPIRHTLDAQIVARENHPV